MPFMRMTALALALALAALAPAARGMDRLSCEKTGDHVYRISFAAVAKDGEIAIYASARADRIDSKTPVAKTRTSPVDVTAAGDGRIYFHLKPKSGPTRVVSLRRVPVDGAPNLRDLGGYATSDGRHVRWGLAFRSGQLDKLTEKDYRTVSALGLRVICDFRQERERKSNPTNWTPVPQPVFVLNPIDSYPPRVASGGANQAAAQPPQSLPEYWWIANASQQYGDMFRRVAAGEVPFLFHCAAGKDRAGTFAALLLTALGAPRETVMEDYRLTNAYLVPDSRIPQLAASLQKRRNLPEPPDADTVRGASGGVNPKWLTEAFAAMEQKYGSVDNYLRDELKLTPADLAALRARLLEP